MSYITLHERSKMFNLDIDYEFESIVNKFKESIGYFRSILSKERFKDYPLRNYASSFTEYIHLSFDVELIKIDDKSEKYLFISEVILNLYAYVDSMNLNVNFFDYNEYEYWDQIKSIFYLYFERVEKVLSVMGYNLKIVNDRELDNYDRNQPTYVILTKTSPLSDKVAAKIDNPKIKFDILKFNHYKISDDEKQVLIEDMYKYFEGLRGNSVVKTANALANLMNNGLRHNSKERIKNQEIANYVNENKTQALDEAYNLLIECYYHNLNLPIINKLKKISNES